MHEFMKLLIAHMKVICVVTAGLLCLPTYSYGQILPDTGNRSGDHFMRIDTIDSLRAEGKVQDGFITPMACGKHYLNYTACYRWASENDASEQHCFRTNQADFLNKNLKAKKVWVERSVQSGFLMDFDKPSSHSKKEFQSAVLSTYEAGWRTGGFGSVIDCAPSEPITPFILETITAVSPFILPFGYDLEGGARENCLLAEHITHGSSTRYWYDRTQFYCLEVDTIDDAVGIADSFRTAYSEDEAYISRASSGENRKHFTIMLRAKQLAFTNITQADVQIAAVSQEEIEAYYERTGATPEIMSGKAAVVFAIDEKINISPPK